MATILGFKQSRPTIDDSVYLADTSTVIGDVTIGRESSIWFGCVLRGDVMSIRVGEQTSIQDNTVIHVTTGLHETVIGNRVTVGHRALLHGCAIHDRALIGMGAIVMDGATVGEHCIIGAGSTVTPGTEIPAGHLALGTPAVVKRRLTSREKDDIDSSAERYVELAAIYVAARSA